MRRKTFFSIGFFGFPNLGDELLCLRVTRRIRKLYPLSKLYIMTRNSLVSRDYAGVQANFVEGFWPSPKYFANFPRHVKAVADSDLIVIGGGGLISDKYDRHAFLRHCIDPLIGVLLNKPYVFVGLGVTELKKRLPVSLASYMVTWAAEVYCRDSQSSDRLRRIARRDDIVLGPDLAFLSSLPTCVSGVRDYALINIREDPPVEVQRLITVCGEMLKHVSRLVFLATERADVAYFRRILTGFPEDISSKIEIAHPDNLSDTIQIVVSSKFVVACRLHVNILTVMSNKPLLAICYEDKVKQFVSQIPDGVIICNPEEVDEKCVKHVAEFGEVNHDQHVEQLCQKAQQEFDNVIFKGLYGRKYSAGTRIEAFIWLAYFMSYGVIYTILAKIKRSLLGKGPVFRKNKYD